MIFPGLRLIAAPQNEKKAGPKPRRDVLRILLADQRRSCNTLCCDWLASDSAETAID